MKEVVLDPINIKSADHPEMLLYCVSCGTQFFVSGNCGHRSCAKCRYKAFLKIFNGYKYIVEDLAPSWLITITRKNRKTLEREWINSLRISFVKMLHKVYYKSRISGGMYAIECIEKGKGWNLHLHCIYSGDIIDRSRLSTDLMEYTGDSYIAHVVAISDPLFAFRYILKDLTKNPNLNGKSAEYDEAFRRFRFVSKFGDWYKFPLKDDHVPACPNCGDSDLVSEFFVDQQIRIMKNGH